MKRIIIEYKNLILKVNISKEDTCILDSYKVRNIKDMSDIIYGIRSHATKDMAVFSRSISSMIAEWRVHNLLYELNIQRDRTKDVNLNSNQPWYIKAIYYIISPFYLHF